MTLTLFHVPSSFCPNAAYRTPLWPSSLLADAPSFAASVFTCVPARMNTDCSLPFLRLLRLFAAKCFRPAPAPPRSFGHTSHFGLRPSHLVVGRLELFWILELGAWLFFPSTVHRPPTSPFEIGSWSFSGCWILDFGASFLPRRPVDAPFPFASRPSHFALRTSDFVPPCSMYSLGHSWWL